MLTGQLQPLLLAEAGTGVCDRAADSASLCDVVVHGKQPRLLWPERFPDTALQPASHCLRKIQGCGPRQGCGTDVASYLARGGNGSNFFHCVPRQLHNWLALDQNKSGCPGSTTGYSPILLLCTLVSAFFAGEGGGREGCVELSMSQV